MVRACVQGVRKPAPLAFGEVRVYTKCIGDELFRRVKVRRLAPRAAARVVRAPGWRKRIQTSGMYALYGGLWRDMMVQITNRNGKSVLIPDDAMLADAIRALPQGVRSDLGEVRRALASAHGVDQTCPVTTQRLLVQFSQGGDVPYWRVVDPEKPFAKRLAGGGDRVRQEMAAESRIHDS